jgi:hypothetical protein
MIKTERMKHTRAKRLKAGLCGDCGKRKRWRKSPRCRACLRKVREGVATLRRERRARGECTTCGCKVSLPERCDACKQARSSETSPPRVLKTAVDLSGTIGRARLMSRTFASILLLRTGRWTIAEWADELGLKLRTAYRLIHSMRRAGITIEVSREREHERGMATPLYTIPAEPLRKLLRL